MKRVLSAAVAATLLIGCTNSIDPDNYTGFGVVVKSSCDIDSARLEIDGKGVDDFVREGKLPIITTTGASIGDPYRIVVTSMDGKTQYVSMTVRPRAVDEVTGRGENFDIDVCQ